MAEQKIYAVPKEFENRTHIRNDQYLAMYDASINRPDEFWSQKADEFIAWFKPWNKVTKSNLSQGEAKWFLGAELNASYNCIDRHLELKSDHTAIIWSAEGEQKRVLKGHTSYLKAVAVLPNGDIITGSDDKTAIIWTAEGTQKRALKGHTCAVRAVAVLPDSDIVTSSND